MKSIKSVILNSLIVFTGLTGCRSPERQAAAEAAAAANTPVESADLTQAEAAERSARVSKVRYQLTIDLNETDETFGGANVIDFTLTDVGRPLRLDFHEGSVAKLTLNGAPVAPSAKHRYWITLPAELLKVGENRVEIEYTSAFTRAGRGLHRFVDPETREVFVYSSLEPYYANMVYPCFDQPDLRATWDLTVHAPAKWQVMHTTRERAVRPEPNGRHVWTFPRTPAIATYLFSLHAGPYRVWTDRYKTIPLRIWARPSQAKFVRVKEWFNWTRKGLAHYGRYFDHEYPFGKYDQIFVPEASGAMENVGAVTFGEYFLFRSEPTRAQARNSADVLLHEMAHMWFGDLVTMKWWNDLWLNESFATFMAALALHETTDFKEAWQDFFRSSKQRAYLEDGFVTTHPIEATVAGVKDGLAAFDQITYGKGASVLKQLRAYVGPKTFDEGIRRYIRAHQYGNTTLTDFIGALQAGTTKDLTAWAQAWLRQTGADRLEARWTCAGPRLTEIKLMTELTPGVQFRPQRLKVGLFPAGESVDVDVTGPEQTVRGDWACPKFVYPNFDDHGYVAVRLDERSRTWAADHLNELRDPLLRTQVWRDLWEMLRAGELPVTTFASLLERHLPSEHDEIVIDLMLGTVTTGATHSILHYWPPAQLAARDQFVRRMEGHYLERARTTTAPARRRVWFDEFVYLAQTPEALDQLARWLDGRDEVAGVEFDLDRRWLMVKRLARFRPAAAKPFLAALKAEDTGDRGRRFAMATEATMPDPEIKRRWVDALSVARPEFSLVEARDVMKALFPWEQNDLARAYDGVILDYLRTSAQTADVDYLRSYTMMMSPLRCEDGPAAAYAKLLRSTTFPLIVKRTMQVALQEDDRCRKIRGYGVPFSN